MDRSRQIAQDRLAQLTNEMRAMLDAVKLAGRQDLTRSEREKFSSLDSEYVALAIETYVGADEKKSGGEPYARRPRSDF
jgi:hypothetical protein